MLFQGLIYHNNIPIQDILFKSNNKKFALWYLIRLYYVSSKSDPYELFILNKISNLINTTDNKTFILSYTKFLYQYKDLLSILIFIISNQFINLQTLYEWTSSYNELHPNNKIIVKERLIFDTDSRLFNHNIKLDQINFMELSNPLYLQYNIQNQYDKLILNHYAINPIHKSIMDNNNYTINNSTNLSLKNYSKPFLQTSSILDKYQNWNYSNRFNKYNINTFLLDKLTFKNNK